MSNRRIFVKQAAAISLLYPLRNIAIGGGNKLNKNIGEREILAEPGPMIPPVPAILLSVNGQNDSPDQISVVWTFVVNGKPPQIGISVEDPHVVLDLIKKKREFVLNVPTSDMIESFDKIDMNSSRLGDKFALSGFTAERAQSIDAPAIAESPIHVECNVIQELRVPPIRTVFIAEVTATTVLPGVCDEKGRLIVEDVDFFGMTAGSGEFYTMGDKIGHIGKTVGRDDIKY